MVTYALLLVVERNSGSTQGKCIVIAVAYGNIHIVVERNSGSAQGKCIVIAVAYGNIRPVTSSGEE